MGRKNRYNLSFWSSMSQSMKEAGWMFFSSLTWMQGCPTTDGVFLDPHPHIQPGNLLPKQLEHLRCHWRASACAGSTPWFGSLETGQVISSLFHHTLLLWDTWLMQVWFTLCSFLEILLCVSYCVVFLGLKITSVWVNGKLQAEVMPLEMLLFSTFQVENKFQPGSLQEAH